MTIKELREKRAKAWDDAREFLDSKRNDSGLLSEEDSKTYDDMGQQIVAYGKEIERLERQEKLGRELNAATTTPLVSNPGTHTEQTEKTGIASESYNKAFWNNIRNRNYIDVRNDLQIGTDSEGGYLCPDEVTKSCGFIGIDVTSIRFPHVKQCRDRSPFSSHDGCLSTVYSLSYL